MTPQDRAQDVLAPPAKAAIFLTVTVRDGKEQEARDALADVAGITRAIGFRIPEAALSCVVGIGAEAWDRLYAAPRPDGLHPFRPLAGRSTWRSPRPATCSSTYVPDALISVSSSAAS